LKNYWKKQEDIISLETIYALTLFPLHSQRPADKFTRKKQYKKVFALQKKEKIRVFTLQETRAIKF